MTFDTVLSQQRLYIATKIHFHGNLRRGHHPTRSGLRQSIVRSTWQSSDLGKHSISGTWPPMLAGA